MVQVIKNVLSPEQVQQLLEYHRTDDERTDDRPNVRSKHPRWDQDTWPQQCIKTAVDQALGEYTVEEVIILESRMGFKIHVDTSDGSEDLFKTCLFPLSVNGAGHTVFFDAYWDGPSRRFESKFDPFRYELQGRSGEMVTIPDLRTLNEQLTSAPDTVTDFDVTPEFIKEIARLVDIRSGNSSVLGKDLSRNIPQDHSRERIRGWSPDKEVSADVQRFYLQHIDPVDLEGLGIDCIIRWEPGDMIVFDRRQLHCASHTHRSKIGLTVFTRKPNTIPKVDSARANWYENS